MENLLGEEFDFKKTKPLTKTFVFVPSDGKDMKTDYPELASIEEFRVLNNSELIFAWLVGNATSPLCTKREANRIEAYQKALKWSKLEAMLDNNDISNYTAGRFPSKIDSAIKKMASFNPSIRMKAKMMSEKMLENLSKMVDVSEEELEAMEIGDKKKYAELCTSISGTLDTLIVANEEAYGIKERKRKAGDKASGAQPTLMDLVMTD